MSMDSLDSPDGRLIRFYRVQNTASLNLVCEVASDLRDLVWKGR